jgi:hypothetical protein
MDNRAAMAGNARQFDLARRGLAYAASALLASLVYMVWLAVSVKFGSRESTHTGLLFGFGFASIFWLTGGFALALVLMILPWAVAVWAQRKTRWDRRFYFPFVGALLVFILGCAAGSIMPKPLFVDEQTFLEGAAITAQREGLCMVVCGIAFGACYWWLDRRNRATL